MTMQSRLWHGIADHFRLRFTSWVMSANMVGFGVIICLNPAVMVLPGRTVLYAGLLRIAPVQTWGVICLMIGGFRLASLVVNGTFPSFRLSPHIRAVGSFLSSLFWLQIVLGAMHADQITLALSVFSTFMVMDGFSLYAATLEIDSGGTPKEIGA